MATVRHDLVNTFVLVDGVAPSEVTRIIATHAHPDHVGGLAALRGRTGAAVARTWVAG